MTKALRLTPHKLDKALLDAHDTQDVQALVHLYTRAADQSEARSDVDACCFYLTQAYVFALQIDAPENAVLHCRLKMHGREE